jgi:hypothetical protein
MQRGTTKRVCSMSRNAVRPARIVAIGVRAERTHATWAGRDDLRDDVQWVKGNCQAFLVGQFHCRRPAGPELGLGQVREAEEIEGRAPNERNVVGLWLPRTSYVLRRLRS